MSIAQKLAVGMGAGMITIGMISCGSNSAGPSSIEAETVTLERGTRFASIISEQDIVDWGSYVLRVSVVSEAPRNTSSLGPGERVVGRDVEVNVDRIVWSHPAAVRPVKLGAAETIYTFPGYVESNSQRSPAVEEGDVRMEVGSDYAVVLADDVTPEGEQIFTLLAILPLDAENITLPNSDVLNVEALLEAQKNVSVVPPPQQGISLVERLEGV